MGNAQSAQGAESHGRPRASQPQKLSKPKVGNPSTASKLQPGPSGRRHSTPGSVDRTNSLPAAPSANIESVNHALPPLPATESLNKQLPPLLREPQDRNEFDELQEKKMSRRLSIFRSRSSSREPGTSRPGPSRRNSIFGSRKHKTDESVSQANSRVTSRANSLTVDSGAGALYSARGSDVLLPNGSQTSWNIDMNSYEARRLWNLAERHGGYEHTTATSESRHTMESDTRSSSAAQVEIAPINRVNSDVSLYAPARRRSIVQIPGVATRTNSLADTPRPNFRHSLPPTPSLSRQASFESTGSRHLSFPPLITGAELAPRVLTPNDGEYQTTGAFKFGTLRIVNGAASPTPVPETHSTGKGTVDRSALDYFTHPRKIPLVGGTDEVPAVHLQVPSTSASKGGLLPPGLKVSVPEFLPSIQYSPFDMAETVVSSSTLQTTSKHTALEDDLFEDEPRLESVSREVLDVRLDPNAKSDGKQPRISTKNLSRSDSGFVPSPTSEYSVKALSKADSGYSSIVSLRSLRGSAKYSQGKTATSPTPQVPMSPQSNSSHVSSPMSAQPAKNPSANADIPPMLPPKELYSTPTSQSTKDVTIATPIPMFSIQRLKKRPSPSPISTTKSSLKSGLRSPDSAKSPSSATSAGSGSFSNSSLSVGSGTQRKSKFHRVFSMTSGSQRGPPTTHTTHVEDQSGLPSIPPNVEAKLDQHVGLYPSTPKRLALKTQRSKDTLRTIFSVGSLEFHNMDPESATTDVAKEEPAPEPAPKPQPARHRHSFQTVVRRPIARKPLPEQDERHDQVNAPAPKVGGIVESQMVRPSSVNKSLGVSPYDAACPSSQARRDVAGRAMSMKKQEKTAAPNAFAARGHTTSEEETPLSPSSQTLVVPELAHLDPRRRGRTPPPVAMRTQRTPAVLRVPPPRRSKSTPPTANRPMITIEEMKALKALPMPSMTPQPMSQTHTASHRMIPVRDPRMGQGSYVRPPSRGPSPGPNSSRRNSLDQSRNNSLSSQGRAASGLGLQRPASSTAHRRPSDAAPRLLHSASYDGFSNPHRQSWAGPGSIQQGYILQQQQKQQQQMRERQQHKQQQVANVFLQQNGVPFVPQGVDINHQKISQPSWEQGGRYPSAFPKGHHRHKSLGDQQTPFRVLHSYNSPAYRGVPIWG